MKLPKSCPRRGCYINPITCRRVVCPFWRLAFALEAFEKVQAMMIDDQVTETSSDLLARLGTDGAKWAAEFRLTALRLGYSNMDEGWLVGWFANAIEAGREAGRAPGRGAADWEGMEISWPEWRPDRD
jgi:hypothetical protein